MVHNAVVPVQNGLDEHGPADEALVPADALGAAEAAFGAFVVLAAFDRLGVVVVCASFAVFFVAVAVDAVCAVAEETLVLDQAESDEAF